MITRRRFLASSAFAGLPYVLSSSSLAQSSYRGVRIVVGFPPGGGTDVAARLLANKLRSQYADGLLVDNRPGASGRIAVDQVKTGPNDGSTLLFTPDFVLTIYPHSFAKLSYDPLRDLTPVAMCAKTSYAISVGTRVPANVRTINDVLAWCKANPKEAAFASTSAGSATHFAGVMLAHASGVEILHVPYKGGALALQDLIGGQIPISINPIGEILPQLKSGKVRVLATTGGSRNRFLPDVPTLVESGIQSAVVEAWMAVLMPAQTPVEIVAKTSVAINTALQDKDVQEGFAKLAMETVQSTPRQLASAMRMDIERWRPVVKASGFIANE
jgi:tripartite-type tricarboxylate transporter receptor subunit TctC